ncbi:hypothetical protein MN608_10079 [Microdochium nivale]|nr:hypothetical protein MN608_10079 [Microdochium nivale]
MSPVFAAQVAENVRCGDEMAALLLRHMGTCITVRIPESPPQELESDRWAKTEGFFRQAGVELRLGREDYSLCPHERPAIAESIAHAERSMPSLVTGRRTTIIGNTRFEFVGEPF